jgi:hypothetical protein
MSTNPRRAAIILILDRRAYGDKLPSNVFDYLIGRQIHAFGPKGRGLWGSNSTEVAYTIKKTKIEYYDSEYRSIDIRIYLNGYTASKYGLIYTDEVFEKEIKTMMSGFKVEYTEQGMQGSNYVSLNVTLKK